ncbi:hypothetical protein AAVH_30321 [Aphelenchoides avenae]|nr:hypothetical protein AAVH_30321 [Aphelenchus avenae]
MLPNETLLDVLHCADYATLVYAELEGARLQHLGTQFAAQLARRRKFRVRVDFDSISCVDPSTKRSRYAADCFEGNQRLYTAAARQVAARIGPHAVGVLEFPRGSWNVAAILVVFEAAPVLKYAEEVHVRAIADHARSRRAAAKDLHAHSAAFMRHFSGLSALRLWLDYDLFRQFDWTFLGRESARHLRRITVSDTTSTWYEMANRCVDCLTVPRTLGGEPLLLKNSGRALTFRMSTPRDEQLVLDESDYTVDVVDDNITRYVSESRGIVVEVEGHWYATITIRSTADVHRAGSR